MDPFDRCDVTPMLGPGMTIGILMLHSLSNWLADRGSRERASTAKAPAENPKS